MSRDVFALPTEGIAKTINEKSTPYNRPVSDLKVTYLVFPDSEDAEKGPPDLDKWSAKCADLLNGLGGLSAGTELYRWRDIVADKLTGASGL